jgi:hypothetical protein
MADQAAVSQPDEIPQWDPGALAPPDYSDPVIVAYKKDVDVTLLRENLKLTVEERIRKAISFHESIEAWREAGRQRRSKRTASNRT